MMPPVRRLRSSKKANTLKQQLQYKFLELSQSKANCLLYYYLYIEKNRNKDIFDMPE